jgi:hypothetical protein
MQREQGQEEQAGDRGQSGKEIPFGSKLHVESLIFSTRANIGVSAPIPQ